jgi:hypothetical protein
VGSANSFTFSFEDIGLGEAVFKSYSQILLAATALLLLATAAFNWAVDPFQYFGAPRIAGFNSVKTRLRFFERELKPVAVKMLQPEAVIFGSSIADIGFEPLHPDLTRNGRAKSYNFGFIGSIWKENFCALEYTLANTNVQRIVLGIYGDPMPDEDCRPKHAAMNENRLAQMLVSPQALQHSFETLRRQDPSKPFAHTPEGRYLFFRNDPRVEMRSQYYFKESLAGKAGCSEDRLRRSLDEPEAAPVFADSTPFDLSGLARILEQVSGRDIQLRMVLYPRHVVDMEAAYLCGEALDRWLAMYRIALFIEQHPPAPPASVELWDFQNYGPPFDEPLDSGVLTYWQDVIHFNTELGDRMLDDLFSAGKDAAGSVTGFGYRVDTATLAARYHWLAEQRRAFLRAHPQTWDTLMRLVPPEVQRSQPRKADQG